MTTPARTGQGPRPPGSVDADAAGGGTPAASVDPAAAGAHSGADPADVRLSRGSVSPDYYRRMATGFVRDVRNALAMMRMAADAALQATALEAQTAALQSILRTTVYVETLAERLEEVGSEWVPGVGPQLIAPIVDDTMAMLASSLTPWVEVAVRHEQLDGAVIVDRPDLERVLINLVRGAVRAMAFRGTLTVVTRWLPLNPGESARHDWLEIEISDCIGAGTTAARGTEATAAVSPARVSRPGLRAVAEIVSRWGGDVVARTVGRDTAVSVRLPAAGA